MEEKLIASNLITDGVMFQKRTANYKKFTCYYQGRILKFPYSKNELMIIIGTFETLRTWKTQNLCPPLDYFELNNDLGIKGEYVIEYPNLGEDSIETLETYWNQESFSKFKYRVLVRSNLVKLGDVMREVYKTSKPKNEASIQFILDQITPITITLCKIRLVGVKDMGAANILVNMRTKKIYVIDLDQVGDLELVGGEIFYFQGKLDAGTKRAWLERVKVTQVIEVLKKDVTSPRLVEAVSLLSSPSIQIEKTTRIESDPIGQMSYSFRRSITRQGLPLDEVKSGMQKYIRRGEVYKALECTFEIYAFRLIDAKAVITNLYNRIATIAVEDIGPANPDLVLTVVKLVLEENRDRLKLFDIVCNLIESPKTRVLSHVNRVYGPMGQDEWSEGERWSWRTGDPISIQETGDMVYRRLKEKSLLVFYWLFKFTKEAEKTKIPTLNRRTNPIEIIWEMVRPLTSKEVYDTFRKFYYHKTSDAPIFLRFVIFLIVENKEAKEISLEEYEVPEGLFEGKYTLILDDYVIDKHTARGRSLGKDRETFVHEGAVVMDRAPEYDQEKWLKIEEEYKK